MAGVLALTVPFVIAFDREDQMNQTELKWLALIGIKAEIVRLGMLVKELEGETIAAAPPSQAIDRSDDTPRRRRRHMSPAARAKISARMKKYWAGKRG